ncbi:hypothetical protein GCM10008905_11950 [Clostridium malenominatum]|uniref:Uncharacterized protein n=1 Tax=Clostridium malenominatum TaxID=1539 RepID=A0ABP3U361_9CLOT
MKRRNDFLLKAALTTAAVGVGTFIYKKYNQRKKEQYDMSEGEGVIEIEEFEDNIPCACDHESFNEEDMNSNFEIKLDDETSTMEIETEDKNNE